MQELLMTPSGDMLAIRRSDGTVIHSSCTHSGDALSASELLFASLGSCIAASLVPLMQRRGMDTTALRITATPLGTALNAGLRVVIVLPQCPEDVLQRCERAVDRCPVKKALNLPLVIEWRVA